MRPAVVLFDEPVDRRLLETGQRAVWHADVVVAVGTSGTVWPARNVIDPLPHHVDFTLVNDNPWETPHPALGEGWRGTVPGRFVKGDADTVLPVVLDELRDRYKV